MIFPLIVALAVCNGESISTIDIRSHPPSFDGAAAEINAKATELTGVHFATTRGDVVRAYLLFAAGDKCTEEAVRESVRLLRAQSFIATAVIRVIPAGPGQVRVQVDVVDEFPLIAAIRVRNSALSGVLLGSRNLQGNGLYLTGSIDRGFAYPTAFGLRAVQFGAFGRPATVLLDAMRGSHGNRVIVEASEPFLTELRRNAMHLSVGMINGLNTLLQPTGHEVALYARRAAWDIGAVRRIGVAAPGRTVGMLGGVLFGEDTRTAGDLVIVADTGLVDSPDSVLVSRYHAVGNAHVAVVAGVRKIRYTRVSGFNSVNANEDVAEGVQLGALAGPSVWASRGASDIFMATDFYAGSGDAQDLVTLRVTGEVRANHESRRWDGVVGSARLAWYTANTDNRTTVVTLDGGILQSLAFPAQLTFRDAEGGVRGFGGASAAGGMRLVGRVEHRILTRVITSRADFAGALFADAGKLWAGDAPYGVESPVRAAVGFSLLGAYPVHSKRTYRLDLAFPINPERGGSRIEFRISSADRTMDRANEPRDIASRRSGALPAALLRW